MSDTSFDYKKAVDDIQQTIQRLQQPKKVLLVDDDPTDVMLTTKMLNRFNVKVTAVHSGEEANTAMAKEQFDLVLFDLVMPGLDGMDFALHATGLNPKARFVLVTGYPTSPRIEAVLRLGAVMFSKPLTEQSLELILTKKSEPIKTPETYEPEI